MTATSQLRPGEKPENTKVIIGMSGGVDSSVSAYLLLQEGFQVEGLFMKNWDEDDGTEYCTAREDLADARKVCETLGIKLHEVNFAAEYWDEVFEYFLSEYQAGRTPNPDILCNREIKFGAFLDYAKVLGADYIATGHYAQKEWQGDTAWLTRSLDDNKDQTYFLYAINQTQLQSALFPLGHMVKEQVRELAQANGLITHNKKDSTGICFIGERKFRDFLSRYLPAKSGQIKDEKGNVLGTHDGALYYTIGQRQGLHIGGVSGAEEAPWYVADKDVSTNTLTVVQGKNHPLLLKQNLKVNDLHWISKPGNADKSLTSRIRHRQPLQNVASFTADTPYNVTFKTPQRAVTPGQSIVLYDGNRCLGGGIIA